MDNRQGAGASREGRQTLRQQGRAFSIGVDARDGDLKTGVCLYEMYICSSMYVCVCVWGGGGGKI